MFNRVFRVESVLNDFQLIAARRMKNDGNLRNEMKKMKQT